MTVWLVMKTDTLTGRPFPVPQGRTVIGREPHTDVRIPIPGIGPRHAEITHDPTGIRITDLGFSAGTLHNGKPVREARLDHADELTIGPVTFTVHVGASDEAPGPLPERGSSVTEPKPRAFPVRPEVTEVTAAARTAGPGPHLNPPPDSDASPNGDIDLGSGRAAS